MFKSELSTVTSIVAVLESNALPDVSSTLRLFSFVTSLVSNAELFSSLEFVLDSYDSLSELFGWAAAATLPSNSDCNFCILFLRFFSSVCSY